MATFTVYKTRSGARYGVLSGGATKNYEIRNPSYFESSDKFANTLPDNPEYRRDWVPNHKYAWSFKCVRINKDVTGIGRYCFAFFENADFIFEDHASIKSLGTWAFACSGIKGKVSLPGLESSPWSVKNAETGEFEAVDRPILPEAFSGCGGITEVDISGSKVTVIDDKAFMRCHNLKKVTGCFENIVSVGERAFARCAALESIDLNPDKIETIGNAAFHITSVGKSLDKITPSAYTPASTLKQKFDAQTLSEIRSIELPDVGRVPKYICEQSYPDLAYAKDSNGNTVYMSSGCLVLSIYHAVKGVFRGKQYSDFADWWKAVNDEYAEANNGVHLYDIALNFETYDLTMFRKLISFLGLEAKKFDENDCLLTWGASAKQEIYNALSSGYGVIAGVSTGAMNTDDGALPFNNSHEVAIVGVKDGKLIVVDSASINGEKGGVYRVAYEDLFMGYPYAQNDIRVLMRKKN